MLDETWFWVGVSIGGGLLLGSLIGIATRRVFDNDSRRPALRQIAQPLSLFSFWLCVGGGLVAAVATASPETLRPLPSRVLEWLPNVAIAGVILIGGYALGLTIAAAVGRSVGSATGIRQRSIERTVRGGVVGGAAILAFSQLGVDTTILNVLIAAIAFGVVSALAGLAIVGGRRVAEDLAAGRALEPEIEPGDEIEVAGVMGTVERMTATHLVLVASGTRVLVPYSEARIVVVRAERDDA